jgi:hypothetical protein
VECQELSYTSVTKAEFGGSLGMMMQMVPDAMDDVREATFIKGTMMRTDSDDSSTIMDFSAGRFTHLQHDEKTWYSFTLEEMQERMEAMAGQMQAEMPPEAAGYPGAGPEGGMEMRFSIDRTGETMDMGGFTAEQVFMVIEMVPTTAEAQEWADQAGTTVIFTEIWMADDVPGYQEFQEAQAELGQEMIRSGRAASMGASFQQAFAMQPGMQEAMEESMKELGDMGGLAVKTVTSVVTVPPGAEFDRDAVLAAADQPLSEGTGNLMGEAAAAAGQEAARAAMRDLTRGVLGRRRRQQEEPQAEEPAAPMVQTITMRITNTIEDVRTGGVSDEIFQTPADYREVDPGWGGGGTR